jgi:hypothetical protein
LSCSLLIHGNIAAVRQEIQLSGCPKFPSHLYQKGIVVPDQERESLNITRNAFHGEWTPPSTPSPRQSERLTQDGLFPLGD